LKCYGRDWYIRYLHYLLEDMQNRRMMAELKSIQYKCTIPMHSEKE
jgi:hypothetical protein